jgi:hypothetical protein
MRKSLGRWRSATPQRLARLLAFRPGDFMVRVPAASHWIVRETPELVCGDIERFVSPARA